MDTVRSVGEDTCAHYELMFLVIAEMETKRSTSSNIQERLTLEG